MRRTTIAIASSAALIGGAALAVTAQGQDQTTKTITFTAGQPARRDIKQIDIKPHGESLGDQNIVAATVRRDGKPIGRLLSQCTAADARYEGQACTITLLTRDGQIIAQGAGEHRALPGHGGNPGTGENAANAQYCPPRSHNPGGRPPCGCKAAIIIGVPVGGGCGAAIAACSGRKRDCDTPPPCPPASPNAGNSQPCGQAGNKP